MLDKLLRQTDFDQMPLERRVPVLEHRRRQILESAIRDKKVLEYVLSNKADIAKSFREIGGSGQEDTARFFEGLSSELDIIEALPDEMRQKLRHRIDTTIKKPTSEFFVFCEAFSEEQVKTIKHDNPTGRKLGKQIPIDILGLFRCKENGGTIYLNLKKTEALMKQLQVITLTRPDIIERLYFVEWDEDGKAKLTKYEKEDPIKMGTQLQHLRAVRRLGEYINYRPKQGDVFNGRVVEIYGNLITVEFLPGITGEISIDSEEEEALYQVGMELKVKIGRIWGKNGYVKYHEDDGLDGEYEPPHQLSYKLYQVDDDAPLFSELSALSGQFLLDTDQENVSPFSAPDDESVVIDIVAEE